jgi:hypothetical protein
MDILTDILMDTCLYTNRGKEVPLGVECAIPYLVRSTPSPMHDRAEGTDPTRCRAKTDRCTATAEEPGQDAASRRAPLGPR